MRTIACGLLVLLFAVWAEEPAPRAGPAPLKPPKGVTLTPPQEKLLADANAALDKGYGLLVEKHEPGQAVEELRKALALVNQLAVLMGDEPQLAGVAPGNEKGTPFDKIKMSGSIEKIVEIGAAIGISAPDEVDNGLHKRKIIEDAKETAKKIDAEQKQVTLALQASAGGGGEDKPPQPQAQQSADAQAAQQNQDQPAAKTQEPAAKGQEPAAKSQEPGAKSQELAGKEDAITRELNKLAAQLAEAGQANQAQQAFRKAAGEAAKTADLIRQGETQTAAAASRQTERAIQNALHEAGLAGEGALAAAVSAIENQLSKLQAGQQDILSKAQQLGQAADGSQAPERVQQGRATTLAVEQGKLKPRIEDLQGALEDLSRPVSGGNPAARSTENAARAELAAAATEMQKNRPKQAVVNAAIKLAQGETPAAAKAMAQVQVALDAAQQRVAAADAALASGDVSRLESAYRAVQQLAASTRRLEQTALNAAGQPEAKSQEPGAKSQEPGAKSQEPGAKSQEPGAKSQEPGAKSQEPGAKSQEAAGDGQSAIRNPQSPMAGVSPSWGQVLNRTAEQLGAESGRAAKRIGNLAPDVSQQLGAAAQGTKTEFERDFAGSLGLVRKLLTALEKAEQALGARVAREKEAKALRNYRKEDIPRAYREAVAAYYEELAKEEKK